MIHILVRFDDICPTMNFKRFKIAVELMDKYNIKPLLGVIPDCKDSDLMIDEKHEDFWDYIKSLQNKGYTIAMHGVNHVFTSQQKGVTNNRIGSEFSGVPLSKQVEIIQEGKRILETHDISTKVFFAPAHSYDWNTIKALGSCGFEYMSDGKSTKPYMLDHVKCLPCRANGCPVIGKSGYYTAVFHAHEWERKEKEYDFHEFCNLIEKYNENIVPFEIYAKQPLGNLHFQRITESVYLVWQYSIKPVLSKCYHTLKG